MVYSAQVEMVHSGSTVAQVPMVREVYATPVHLRDDSPWIEEQPHHVDIPLLPWVTDAGAMGYAGWALVGDTLRGFVRESPDAGLVKLDLTARLDRLLLALESGSEAGVEFVLAAERGDRADGETRLRLMERARCYPGSVTR